MLESLPRDPELKIDFKISAYLDYSTMKECSERTVMKNKQDFIN